jgi:predicted PhzF superfamily epimerase YddE/YHI9
MKQLLRERFQQLAGIKTISYNSSIREEQDPDAQTNVKKNVPSDVKALDTVQQTSQTIVAKSQQINTIQEFSGAFENWISSLGLPPDKITKSALRTEVEKVLTNLGYK